MNSTADALLIKSKFFNSTIVRFFLSAGVAFLVDVIVYFICITFIYKNQPVKVFNIQFSASSFCLFISYTCGVITNFLLTKYAVFSESTVAGRKQFFRFSLIAGIGFFANYVLLKFFVEYWNIWPTLARIISALSLGVASYFIHKLFTFRIKD